MMRFLNNRYGLTSTDGNSISNIEHSLYWKISFKISFFRNEGKHSIKEAKGKLYHLYFFSSKRH